MQAVIEFDNQYYSPSDLETFRHLMSLPPTPVDVHGSNDPSLPGGEATLDVQMITSVGVGIPTTFWYSKGFLLDYVMEISNTTSPPLVQSISYGNVCVVHTGAA